MSDEKVGPAAPIVSVRPGRNRLADEDRFLQAAKRERKRHQFDHDDNFFEHHPEKDHSPQVFEDSISLFGIPKEEMTDNVRTAIEKLLGEIQSLREELQRTKGHEAYLEAQAEKDRLLHVMRRRAFLARLSMAVRRVDEEQAQFTFVYIQVTNAPAVSAGFGHSALDSLMMQAASALREQVDVGDVVGSLDSGDFGVLLPGTSLEDGDSKAHRLVKAMAAKSFAWQGQELGVQAAFGETYIGAGDSVDEVIARAKEDMNMRAQPV